MTLRVDLAQIADWITFTPRSTDAMTFSSSISTP